jgi:hypothetical protein
MIHDDQVRQRFRQDTEVLAVASEALPFCKEGAHVISTDNDVWTTWPWEKAIAVAESTITGWFRDRDEEGRLLFLTTGGGFYLLHVEDVEITDYSMLADLSLAWDVEK